MKLVDEIVEQSFKVGTAFWIING